MSRRRLPSTSMAFTISGRRPAEFTEIGDVEDEQNGRLGRDDGRRARRAEEQRHFTEEAAWTENHGLGSQLDGHFARDDEVHCIARLTLAHDDGALSHIARVHQAHNVGNRGRAQPLKESDGFHKVPGVEEMPAAQLLAEGGGDDAGLKCEHNDAADHDPACRSRPEIEVGTTSP